MKAPGDLSEIGLRRCCHALGGVATHGIVNDASSGSGVAFQQFPPRFIGWGHNAPHSILGRLRIERVAQAVAEEVEGEQGEDEED
jgi:hypothetical protein